MKHKLLRHTHHGHHQSGAHLGGLFGCHDYGILWYGMEYGMEGKNRYGRFDVWNGTNLPYSIQIPFLHILTVLLKFGVSFS